MASTRRPRQPFPLVTIRTRGVPTVEFESARVVSTRQPGRQIRKLVTGFGKPHHSLAAMRIMEKLGHGPAFFRSRSPRIEAEFDFRRVPAWDAFGAMLARPCTH